MTRREKRPRAAARPRGVRWTDRARRDLLEIADYIARDNPTAAERWTLSLMELAERAARLPLAGRRVPEIGQEDLREVFLRTYRLVYRVTKEAIDVLSVFEGHRLLPREVLDEAADEPSPRR